MALISNIAVGMAVSPEGMGPGLEAARKNLFKFAEQVDKLKVGLGLTPAKVENEMGPAVVTMRGLGLSMGKALAGGIAAYGVFDFLRDGVDQAARLSEATATLNNLFGQSSGVILKAADDVAALGASKNDFIAGAGGFAAVFDAMGKKAEDATAEGVKLAKLGMDLSADSLTGATSAEAFDALGAALRGEFDSLERFRVFLSAAKIEAKALQMGLASKASALDDNAKKTATLALIYEQTTKSQGAFLRESSGVTAQMKQAGSSVQNLATNIGTFLLPAVTTGFTAFNRFVGGVGSVFDSAKPMIAEWAGYTVEVLQGLGGFFASVAGDIYGAVVGTIGGAWSRVSAYVMPAVDGMTSAVGTFFAMLRNGSTVYEMMKLRAYEWAINVGVAIDTVLINAGRLASWLGNNWYQVISDDLAAVATLFVNFAENVKNLASAVWEFVKNPTGGFSFNWTPLLDGFVKTADALPEMARPAFVSLQGEIDALGQKMADFEARRVAPAAKAVEAIRPPEPAAAAAVAAKPAESGAAKFAGLAKAGTAEAYKAVIAGMGIGKNGPIDKVAKESQQQTRLLTKAVTSLDKIAAGSGAALEPAAL